MKRALKQVLEFHKVTNSLINYKPTIVNKITNGLRIELLKEELRETIDAIEAEDIVEIADGLADLCYVAIGAAVSYGIPLDKVFDEVHRSNMNKAPHGFVKYRSDGKILKPYGWKPPDVGGIIEEALK
jgi:predicted HAD superfamily Cof-like phosphohydrolase